MSNLAMTTDCTYTIEPGAKGWRVIEHKAGMMDRNLFFSTKEDLIRWMR